MQNLKAVQHILVSSAESEVTSDTAFYTERRKLKLNAELQRESSSAFNTSCDTVNPHRPAGVGE
jgi:hypothetical protein